MSMNVISACRSCDDHCAELFPPRRVCTAVTRLAAPDAHTAQSRNPLGYGGLLGEGLLLGHCGSWQGVSLPVTSVMYAFTCSKLAVTDVRPLALYILMSPCSAFARIAAAIAQELAGGPPGKHQAGRVE